MIDEVVKEVRAVREAYARSHGFSIVAMLADLRAKDEAGDWSVVRLPPRRPVVVEEAKTNAHRVAASAAAR